MISDGKGKQRNILIITADSEQSVVASDRMAIFNKYHEINEATIKDKDEDIDNEANVIIGSPDLLVELVGEDKLDLTKTNILVVDDINLIKKKKQLGNLEKFWKFCRQTNRILFTPTAAPKRHRAFWTRF